MIRVRTEAGFTIIELLIVGAIVAILAALAMPRYRVYVARSKQADARVALMDVHSAQERFRALNARYASAVDTLKANFDTKSSYRDYKVAVVSATNTGYVATASVPSLLTGKDTWRICVPQGCGGTREGEPYQNDSDSGL